MTFGESHGKAVGCVCDGVPAGFEFSEADVQPYLDRRRPGQSSLTTKRSESDIVEILSGVENGRTLGSPIAMSVRNQDMREIDYENTADIPRPGHADYTYQKKYGIRASSGGGRSSARETIGRVCAAALAIKYLNQLFNINIVAFVDSVMEINIPEPIIDKFIRDPPTSNEIDKMSVIARTSTGLLMDTDGVYYPSLPLEPVEVTEKIITRCPHGPTAAAITKRISELRDTNNSCGGTVMGIISNLPVGLGEPVFDKFHAELGKAIMSIPAVKGFEIGSGFSGSRTMTGSDHNDPFRGSDGNLRTTTNYAGGVLGGITSGENVYFRVAFKPVSSIGVLQETCDFDGNLTTLRLEGRHDPCVLPRAPQIVESMIAITVMDFVLRNKRLV